MPEFESIKLQVARVLRDNIELRTLSARERVWSLVKAKIPNAKFSTVERMIRHLQNTKKLYLPEEEDINERNKQEEQYRGYFSRC